MTTPQFFGSLRLRLVILVLMTVLPAFGLIVYTALEQRRLAVQAIREEALRLAQIASAEQERSVEGTRQLLMTLAQLPAVREGQAAACTALLTDVLARQSRYLNLGVIKPDGDVACSAVAVSGPVNLADRPYFRRAVETREFAVGEYQVGRITGKATINFGYPVLDPTGAVRSVVFAALDLAWLSQLAADARLPEGTTLTVTDRGGTVLAAYPDPGRWVGESLAKEPLLGTILSRGEGVTEVSVLGGPARLVAFTPLGGAPQAGYVYLSIGIPMHTAFAEADRVLRRGLVGLGLVTLVALIAAGLVSELGILRPVNVLVSAARRLGAGDLSARTGLPHGRGELRQLARTFDEMADAIARRQQELETLFALDRALAQANRPEDVARIAAEHVVSVLGFDAAAAFLLDARGQVLRLLHAYQLPAEVRMQLETIPVGAGVAGRAVAERRVVIASLDAAYPGDAIPQAAAAIRQAGFRTLAATPFLAHGQVYGALTLGSRQRLEPSDRMVALLTSVGTQIGVAVSYAAERERVLSQERLAALGRLAAGVAHELKNPVFVISGRLEMLRTQIAKGEIPAAERLLRHLASLEEADTRMRRILDGLSTYSKPPRPKPQLLNVAELLAATCELVAYQARKSSVTTAVEVPATLPPVRGDRSQLMQVLLNLATNAIEAMAETGGALVLRAQVENPPGNPGQAGVSVEVVDTGPGIPAEKLETIWEPFYTTKPEGTGLGLSIVRSLVGEQPGAGISVASRPGQGTTFTVRLPAAESERGPESPGRADERSLRGEIR